jgi:hypothetical protein
MFVVFLSWVERDRKHFIAIPNRVRWLWLRSAWPPDHVLHFVNFDAPAHSIVSATTEGRITAAASENCPAAKSQRKMDLLRSRTEQSLPRYVSQTSGERCYEFPRNCRGNEKRRSPKLKPRHTEETPRCEEPRHPLGFGALFRNLDQSRQLLKLGSGCSDDRSRIQAPADPSLRNWRQPRMCFEESSAKPHPGCLPL